MNKLAHNLNQERVVFLLSVLIFVIFSIFLPGFLNTANLGLLMQGVSVLGILGIGMCIVVIGRGVDLSMVATMVLSMAWALQLNGEGMSLGLALTIGIAGALLVGLINGLLIAYAEIPPLFAALATSACVYGFGRYRLIHSDLVYVTPAVGNLAELGQGRLGTLPIGTFLNGMTIMDVQYTMQNAIKSVILLAAIMIDTLINPRDEQTAQHGDI